MAGIDPLDDLAEELEELPDGIRLTSDDRPDVEVPEGMLPPLAVERRTLLASALVPSMFPTGAADVVAVLEGADLPDDLLLALAALPEGEYRNVQEIWVAIGGETEERPGAEPSHATPAPAAEERRLSLASLASTGRTDVRRLATRSLRVARVAATAPLSVGATTLSIGAAALQRAADGLTDAATRIAAR